MVELASSIAQWTYEKYMQETHLGRVRTKYQLKSESVCVIVIDGPNKQTNKQRLLFNFSEAMSIEIQLSARLSTTDYQLVGIGIKDFISGPLAPYEYE